MAELMIHLLGSLEVTRDGQQVTGFKSDKERALLSYLAVETQCSHRREKLAGFLWPEQPERAARNNLRRALSHLRLVIGDARATPHFLRTSRETAAMGDANHVWVDVHLFSALVQAVGTLSEVTSQLERAVALYRGDLLEGFSLPDSPAFEEWALLQRERHRRLMVLALHRLRECHEQGGDVESALRQAWRLVEFEPWLEEGHQQVMRLLALDGQRGAALAHYDTCRRLLAAQLGVEPAEETKRLYEAIRSGALPRRAGPAAAAPAVPPLAPLLPLGRQRRSEPFVAREHELACLTGWLDGALTGQGRIVFVTGEAGSGKTALMNEFARRAQDAHAELLVTGGQCAAPPGRAEPYLPFLQALAVLAGDVDARRLVGAIPTSHAPRLWNTLPHLVGALVESGPDLLDTFVAMQPLLHRAQVYAPGGADWLTALQQIIERKAAGAPAPPASELVWQFARVTESLAERVPLLMVLDDLQWADAASVDLLLALGRHLTSSRVLILGAYRPEELGVEIGGHGRRLEAVVSELKGAWGDIVLNLDQTDGQVLVQALVDSEPNRLGPAFRRMLHGQTGGHPLFTVELLRGMRERGDLIQDAQGRWIEGPELCWETLPARVEAAIAERISRLEPPLQAILQVASVEGEVFTAELVARVLGVDEQEVVRSVHDELDQRYHLVRSQGAQRVGSRQLSRHRFRHVLFQQYVYDHLDATRKAQWHGALGSLLEMQYQQQTATGGGAALGAQFPPVGQGAANVARHFEAAGMRDKAAEYHLHAAIRAQMLSANEQALGHFRQGLALLAAQPPSTERALLELRLLNGLANALRAIRASTDDEVVRIHRRIWELCEELPEVPLPLLNGALWILHFFRVSRGEYESALEVAERLLAFAPRAQDPLFVASAHLAVGWVLAYLGKPASARDHLQQMIDFGTTHPQRSLWFIDWQNLAAAMSFQSWALWFLGHPDQAAQQSRAALALAEELDHAWTLAWVASVAGAAFFLFQREGQAAEHLIETMMHISAETGLAVLHTEALCYRGWQQVALGHVSEGIAQLQQGLAAMDAVGTLPHRTSFLAALAEGYLKAGEPDQGLEALAQATSLAARTGERYYLAEIHRLKGELLLLEDATQAAASFQEAIDNARRQRAKSWELRATLSLCRLWCQQGQLRRARQRLSEVYGWFTEGWDTPDLRDARELLERA